MWPTSHLARYRDEWLWVHTSQVIIHGLRSRDLRPQPGGQQQVATAGCRQLQRRRQLQQRWRRGCGGGEVATEAGVTVWTTRPRRAVTGTWTRRERLQPQMSPLSREAPAGTPRLAALSDAGDDAHLATVRAAAGATRSSRWGVVGSCWWLWLGAVVCTQRRGVMSGLLYGT